MEFAPAIARTALEIGMMPAGVAALLSPRVDRSPVVSPVNGRGDSCPRFFCATMWHLVHQLSSNAGAAASAATEPPPRRTPFSFFEETK